jgi:hypothetical protein
LEDLGTPEELTFWGIEFADDALLLRDEEPPLAHNLEERTARLGEHSSFVIRH